MNWPSPKTVRRRFLMALGPAVHVTWPVLSTILAIQVIGFVEGWPVGDAIYFAFVTSLTIGYGDIVPRQALGRALAIVVGISSCSSRVSYGGLRFMPCAQRSPTATTADASTRSWLRSEDPISGLALPDRACVVVLTAAWLPWSRSHSTPR
jgi:hypothetical protein